MIARAREQCATTEESLTVVRAVNSDKQEVHHFNIRKYLRVSSGLSVN